MPDKQANIHNADETEFILNNVLTKIVFAEKAIKRDNHIVHDVKCLHLWYAKNVNNSFIPPFLISKGIRVFCKFYSGINVVLTERGWVRVYGEEYLQSLQ